MCVAHKQSPNVYNIITNTNSIQIVLQNEVESILCSAGHTCTTQALHDWIINPEDTSFINLYHERRHRNIINRTIIVLMHERRLWVDMDHFDAVDWTCLSTTIFYMVTDVLAMTLCVCVCVCSTFISTAALQCLIQPSRDCFVPAAPVDKPNEMKEHMYVCVYVCMSVRMMCIVCKLVCGAKTATLFSVQLLRRLRFCGGGQPNILRYGALALCIWIFIWKTVC